MIVEKMGVKKTLAVTLALALGLSFPGGAAAVNIVAPTSSVSVMPGTAGTAGVVRLNTGTTPVRVNLSALNAVSMSNVRTANLSAPADAAVVQAFQANPIVMQSVGGVVKASAEERQRMAPSPESNPVKTLIDQLKAQGVALPSTLHTDSDAAELEQAANALPANSKMRGQFLAVAASIRAGNAGDGGQMFDGSKPASAETPVPAAPSRLARLAAKLLPAKLAAVVGARKDEPAPQPADPKAYELSVNEVRYAPVVDKLPKSTRDADLPPEPQRVIGQDDAEKAIDFAVRMTADHYNLYVAGGEGGGRAMLIRRVLERVAPTMKTPNSLVAVTNFADKDNPIVLSVGADQVDAFEGAHGGFIEALKENMPVALNSGEAGQKKQAIMAQVQAAQAKAQKAFDAKVASIKLAGKFGVLFQTQETKQGTRLVMGITYQGKMMQKDEVAAHIAANDFTEAEWAKAQEEIAERKGGILEAFQTMMSGQMEMMAKVQATIAKIDQQAAIGVINHFASEFASMATAGPETPADKAFQERAEQREMEINDELQKFAKTKFGKFNVAVQVGMSEAGPMVVAYPAAGKQPINDEIAKQLIAQGQITQAEYDEAKAAIAKKAASIQQKAQELAALTQKEGEALAKKKPAMTPESQAIFGYFQDMANFAANNYRIFLGIKEGGDGIKPMPGSRPLDPEDFFRFSVLTNNKGLKGVPMVWEDNPTYERLFGSADGNMRNMVIPGVGVVKADGPGGPTFKTGSYMKANGGYLVMRAKDMLMNPGVREALMRAAATNKAPIAEGGFMGMASMKGEIYHLPGKVKIILVGDPMYYMLLREHDEDFAMNFQAVAHFQPTIKITQEAVDGIMNFLKHSVESSRGQIKHLTQGAIERVLERMARLAGGNKYFTAQFGAIHAALLEASDAATRAGRDEIRAEDVDASMAFKSKREGVHYERMSELYKDNTFRIDTEGSVVGQANGLAVMGESGVQMRVTAVVAAGAPGIVSTDKDAGSTGSSFNKAIGNLWSMIQHRWGQKAPVKAQFRLSYEQNYGGIDGDSSTSTNFYAAASALSGVPIKQQFAYTGSADVFGNVQAIGGVNEKIEGFFNLCNARGLTGDQGVVIPRTNVKDLQLKPEVAKAIAEGKFHIYAVDHVDQALEIITGVSAKVIDQKATARLAELAKMK